MAKKINISYCLFPLLILLGCENKSSIDIQQLGWMLGSREIVNEDNIVIESWTQRKNVLIGETYLITAFDTLLTETIRIHKKGGVMCYTPSSISNQNKGSPISFKLTSNNPEKLVFENLKHEFPKKIGYYKAGENINVWVEGNNKKTEFYFTTVIK